MDTVTDSFPSLAKRQEGEEGKELYSSWALFLLLTLMVCSLMLSYFLQRRKIQVIHESVVSLLAGMLVGLFIRVANLYHIRDMVTFDHTYFFNMLLPPIILHCGYSLNKKDFFSLAIPIFAFAFVGTFISAMVTGLLAYFYSATGLEHVNLSFLECLMVGAILSSTDPVTVLAVFQQLKVDPKLYTIIFGESMLNDAVSIVLYESYKRFRGQTLHLGNMIQIIGLFFLVFTVSLLIGLLAGAFCALVLKLTQLHRFRHLEICFITMVAYNTYFISNGIQMSGIVSLLFCGIALKHYAFQNMSTGTQHTIHDMFHVLAQLSENFIFIYLGITLFTNLEAMYKPVFIIYMILVIIISRFVSVFPLSRLLNYVTVRFLGQREKCVSYEHQTMLFWAGLRGAVAFALAGDMPGHSGHVTRAMVLVVVVFSVVAFGGTIPTVVRLLNIPTGVEPEGGHPEDFERRPSAASAHLLPTGRRLTSRHRGDPASASRLTEDGYSDSEFSRTSTDDPYVVRYQPPVSRTVSATQWGDYQLPANVPGSGVHTDGAGLATANDTSSPASLGLQLDTIPASTVAGHHSIVRTASNPQRSGLLATGSSPFAIGPEEDLTRSRPASVANQLYDYRNPSSGSVPPHPPSPTASATAAAAALRGGASTHHAVAVPSVPSDGGDGKASQSEAGSTPQAWLQALDSKFIKPLLTRAPSPLSSTDPPATAGHPYATRSPRPAGHQGGASASSSSAGPHSESPRDRKSPSDGGVS
ncbi:monovalent cation:H+ antiporter, CPA1 (nhx1) [Tieghemiomyces parasiticus]|uniref:Sodium/hydrogen exchanger n=1 Tax=Tieghemiomyces parasiticus TaxID=78921 RepID=A0A9W8ACN7_9FUNG|nr:monovalent cation:H+ antiporter, CPA1 (nhx1) [Tieghemiomyces parasiticus]